MSLLYIHFFMSVERKVMYYLSFHNRFLIVVWLSQIFLLVCTSLSIFY